MSDRISVRLTGPAKIEGRWHKAGEDVAVPVDIARELDAAGVIAEDGALAAAQLAPGMPGFDEAVAAMAKVLADAAVQAAVDAACAELVADRDAATARAVEAEAQRDLLQERVLELQAQIPPVEDVTNTEGGEQGADQSEPAAEAAVKNTRKGAAAKKG